jgi:ornithine cyclodeaminase
MTIANDAATGRPVGIVESALLTAMRTAAVSALVLDHAASTALRRVALLGVGVQARTHLRMLAELFPQLEKLTVWTARASTRSRWWRPLARHGRSHWRPTSPPRSPAPMR